MKHGLLVLTVLLAALACFAQSIQKGQAFSEIQASLGAPDGSRRVNAHTHEEFWCLKDNKLVAVTFKLDLVTRWEYGDTNNDMRFILNGAAEMCLKKGMRVDEQRMATERANHKCGSSEYAAMVIRSASHEGEESEERASARRLFELAADIADKACASYKGAPTLDSAIELSNFESEQVTRMQSAEKRFQYVDDCRKLYNGTIDKKQSDLTVRETELVKSCEALDLYPPSK